MKARELIALLISVCGCTQNIGEKYPTNNENVDFSYEIITEEEALETLFDFMDRTDIMTRSESKRAIKSVDKYPLMTKTDSDPEAYIINFVDYKGFAVLGARSDMDEIIAVTESGNIDPVTLGIKNPPAFGDTLIIFPALPFPDEDDEIVVDTLTADNIYSEADDDYYIGGEVDLFISTSIDMGIRYRESPSMPVVDYDYTPNDDASTPSNNPPIKLNMITIWDQGYPYNTKCKMTSNGYRREAGCSSVAAGMITTYNKFPDSLYVDNTLLDWTSMKSTRKLTSASLEPVKTHIPLLLGYFFWNCKRMAGRNYTMITPTQIKKRFVDLGYTDVVLYKDNDFTNEMMGVTSQMIRNNKPVFVSAMRYSKNLPFVSGHSWVIEGVDPYNQMVYCNWGWGTETISSNGYFSINCFKVGNREYDFHFRLLSYNIPNRSVVKYMSLD